MGTETVRACYHSSQKHGVGLLAEVLARSDGQTEHESAEQKAFVTLLLNHVDALFSTQKSEPFHNLQSLMLECDYCEKSFSDEVSYLTHLDTEHGDELGAIEQRRINGLDETNGLSTGQVVLGVGMVAATLIIGYFIVFAGGSGSAAVPSDSVEQVAQQPAETGSAHYHGSIAVIINDTPIDFSQSQYQFADQKFHFERGDGDEWHAHASGITVEYALSTLDIGVTDNSVQYDGTRYTDGEDTTVSIRVNGDPINPKEYVVQPGDEMQVVVRVA